ncbi:hypothetical protein AB0H18_19370 [Streptomyces sp. NPDC020766]|uniref:hypothetical protein n=1 Tax=Streptomyces sp. NPDC020766 TaxID=3155011 RepID=UPI0033D07285
MDGKDRTGPPQWSTSSPEDLDRLARGVLRAAYGAARELRREPPDPDRRTWALGVLAGQTQAMLGPDMPDHPPVGAVAQEGFVRTALALAVHVRAHSWAEKDLGAAGVPGRDDVPHPGERQAADAFDVLGRLVLPDASSEGWTATLATDMARGDNTLEAAVKLGKYILHPTFLLLTDDATRIIGEALHNVNVDRLYELTDSLRKYAGAGTSHAAAEPAPPGVLAPRSGRGLVAGSAPADPERGLGLWKIGRRADCGSVPADSSTPASAQPTRSSEPATPAGPATASSGKPPDTDDGLMGGDFDHEPMKIEPKRHISFTEPRDTRPKKRRPNLTLPSREGNTPRPASAGAAREETSSWEPADPPDSPSSYPSSPESGH